MRKWEISLYIHVFSARMFNGLCAQWLKSIIRSAPPCIQCNTSERTRQTASGRERTANSQQEGDKCVFSRLEYHLENIYAHKSRLLKFIIIERSTFAVCASPYRIQQIVIRLLNVANHWLRSHVAASCLSNEIQPANYVNLRYLYCALSAWNIWDHRRDSNVCVCVCMFSMAIRRCPSVSSLLACWLSVCLKCGSCALDFQSI